jgi:hypothetical protein
MAVDVPRPKGYRRAWDGGRNLAERSHAQWAEDWNKQHRVGTPVFVILDDGSHVRSVTRSDAYLLGHGQAVILLDGFKGCYALDRVVPTGESPS